LRISKSNGEEEAIEDAVIKAYVELGRVIMNENRVKILMLLDKKPHSWTDLMFTLRVSPKVLRDHLRILTANDLVQKGGKEGYKITDASRAILNITLPDMISMANFANKVNRSKVR